MKWLGQYIQDLTARFRHEVYLENISSGTIVSGGNLGLDSNNKIVKATVGGGTVDLTSGVTGTLPVANGGTGFSTVPNKSVVISQDSGTDTLQGVQMDGSGEILIGGASGPAVSTLTQGSNITITNADGGITIANAITNNNQLTNGAGYTTNTGTVDTSGSPVDDDFAKFTDANTIEGRSIAETKTDLSLNNVENKSSATIRGEIVSGDIPNNAANTSGNAATATALETAREISGVAFDGTGDITLNNSNITNGAGYTTNTGDIGGVKFITDSGDNNCVVTSGNATFSLTGGQGIDVVNDVLEITIAGQNASTGDKGVASFDSNHFTVDAGAVSLKTSSLPIANYSLVSSSGTVTTSVTDGEEYAVVIPYDTEQLVSSTNTVVLTGSSGIGGVSGSAYAWYSTTQGDWEYQWNVLSNTNVTNNRILSGVKLQRGTHNGSTMTWSDYNPSVSFIYDRGTGSVRKGSTTNQTLVTQGATQYYWRLVVWKEESSVASTTSITVVTGVSLIVKQIS
tara:strand:- start:2054 stop:3589 length:1536 start_codon:yes stop_codon:yes gene_type:complete